MQDFASFSFDFSNEIETEVDSTLQPKINLVKKLLAQPQASSEQEHTIEVLKASIDESISALLVQIDYEIWNESSASIGRLMTQITQNIRHTELVNKNQILLNIPTTFDTNDLKDFLKQINIDLGELGKHVSADFKQQYFYHQENQISLVNYLGHKTQLVQKDLSELQLSDVHNDCNGLISEIFIGSSEWPWHDLSLTVQHQSDIEQYKEVKQGQIAVLSCQSMDDLSDLFTLVKDNLCSDIYIVLWVSEQFNPTQEDLMMKVLDNHASKFEGLSIFQQNFKTLYGKKLWEWLNTQNHPVIDHSAEKLKFLLIQLKAQFQNKLEHLQSEFQLYSKICLNDDAFSSSEQILAQEMLKELRTDFQTSKTLIEQFAVNVDEVSNLFEKILPEVDFDNAEQKQGFEYQKVKMMLESGFYTEALQHFQTLYHQGMDVIQDIILILANHFDELKNVSLEERFEWIQVATKHSPDNSYFHNLLGICYEQGLGCIQDFVLAFKEYWTASEHDDGYALNKLGECYLVGQGTDTNEEKAFECFKKASEKNSDAKFNLGRCYLWGWGVDKNEKQGFSYLKEAAEQNNVNAQHLLAECYLYGWGITQNDEQAFLWYMKAAEQGYAPAQNMIGNYYLEGIGDIEEDQEVAFAWYSKSAEQGYAPAQNNLGNCYYYGWGVKDSETLMFRWYEKAALQGNPDAQYSLADCYYYGAGVLVDRIKALEWYNKSEIKVIRMKSKK